MSHRRRRLTLVGTVIALALLAIIVGAAAKPMHRHEAVQGIAFTFPRPGQTPFTSAQKVSLDDARSMVGYPLELPTDALASNASIDSVWFNSADNEVVVIYSSGVVEYQQPWTSVDDPATEFNNFLQGENPNVTSVQIVQGQPALVIVQHAPHQQNPGSVDLVLDGIDVTVMGYLETSDLMRIASTVVPQR